MNFNNFTIKSQEVVQKAVQICQNSGHQAIEPVHLLKAMTDDSESVTKFIFQKLAVNYRSMAIDIDRELQMLPKVQGAGEHQQVAFEVVQLQVGI